MTEDMVPWGLSKKETEAWLAARHPVNKGQQKGIRWKIESPDTQTGGIMGKKKAGKKVKKVPVNKDPERMDPSKETYEDDQEEVVSKETCPYCGKVFAELDANGCMVNDFGRCEDCIGEGDDGDFSFKEGFDIFYEIRSLCEEIENHREVHAFISHLTGFKLTSDLSISEIMEMLPEVTVSEHEWDGGGPGCSGYFSYITVYRKNQARLLKKLNDVRFRLEMFVEAGAFTEQIQAKLESPKKGAGKP
jgi:hypothetical protein